MIYVFIPYYNEDTPEFKKSLESQTYKDYRIIRRDRKRDKIYWTKAVRDFQKEVKRFCGAKDDDIVCVMNNDIEFDEYLFGYFGRSVRKGDVTFGEGVWIDWSRKDFEVFSGFYSYAHSFTGHLFFMTLGDFKRFKFSRLLPHALADIDYGLKVLRELNYTFIERFTHKEHTYQDCHIFSLRSYKNPILWTIFLLKHPNRYTFINILKSWYEIIRLFRKS